MRELVEGERFIPLVIINKTPHCIRLLDADRNEIRRYPKPKKRDRLIRLSTRTEPAGALPNGVPLTKTVFLEPEGLPVYQDGVFYIVSQLVKDALPERGDLLVPAEIVRNKRGHIIGCRSFGI
jgi:hypothetical protein